MYSTKLQYENQNKNNTFTHEILKMSKNIILIIFVVLIKFKGYQI